MTYLERIQIGLFRMFEQVACNPEFWFIQYAPVFCNIVLN
jgi:hypothetical protein